MIYYKSLDGLRAIAVSIVVLAHAGAFIRSGGVGVDIFFVLSGFLITSILSIEVDRKKTIYFRNFYAKRFLRLSPCLIVVCIFYSAWSLLYYKIFPYKDVIIALSYTANYARAIYNMNLHALYHCWSLANEEQFYLIWPVFIFFIEKKIIISKKKIFLLVSFSILLVIYRLILTSYVPASRIYFALDTHMDGLVLGSALSYIIKNIQNNNNVSEFNFRLLSFIFVPVSILWILFTCFFLTWNDPFMLKYGFFLTAISSAIIISDLIIGKYSLIRKTLSSQFIVYIGKISYGLYLWHAVLFYIVDKLLLHNTRLVKVPVKLALAFTISVLSYHIIEVKFLRLKKHFDGKIISNELTHSTK